MASNLSIISSSGQAGFILSSTTSLYPKRRVDIRNVHPEFKSLGVLFVSRKIFESFLQHIQLDAETNNQIDHFDSRK